jgi:hypothetical protein
VRDNEGMTDFLDPSGASLRLSNAERDEAVATLQANARDGRLTDSELAERSAAARAATTRGDLAPLFADLPVPSGRPAQAFAPPAESPYAGAPRSSAWSPALQYIAPLVAVVLFFLTGWAWGFQYSWLWFILVPLAWAVARGVEGSSRDRDRDRDRR